MKKIVLMFIALVAFFNLACGQPPQITKGTKLTYHVEYNNGTGYDYVVTVNNFGPSISFGWRMTAPVNSSGKVSLSSAALQNATSYKNSFSNASDLKLTGESTVWLSRKNFNDLKTGPKTTMNMTGEPLEFIKNTAKVTASYKLRGVVKDAAIISCEYLPAGDILYTVNVFDDPKNPLIQYLSLGDFTITLKSVD
jgi:hypothetical protein